MAYKVLIKSGKGKNFAQTGSLPLANKEEISLYVKRSPIGNSKSYVEIEDTESKKVITGNKLHFSNTKLFDI